MQKELLIFAGPCQIESEDHALRTAEEIKIALADLPVKLFYKSSYDKANRTSLNAARGTGITEGLRILAKVKQEFDVGIITDVHSPAQAQQAGEVVDILQIPAFLCRQTDLLLAAGKTGRSVNIKKGQFLHPSDMKYCAEKVQAGGAKEIFLCERGSCFGYRELIVDFRGLLIMKNLGYPVIFDATHSVQIMGGAQGSSGGAREYVKPLAKAAAAIGIDGLFVECHQNPDQAPSDGKNMLEIKDLRPLVQQILDIRQVCA